MGRRDGHRAQTAGQFGGQAVRIPKVIAASAALVILMATDGAVAAQQTLSQKFDSLFVIASSGEVMFTSMVGPAEDSIAAMGVAVVPLLIERFTTYSARERWTVVNCLKKIGSAAVPDLVAALRRPDWEVVQRVAAALGDIADTSAVPALVVAVGHENWQVREQSVRALGLTGHPGDGASKSVLGALSDSVEHVRKAAAVACRQFKLQQATPTLVHLLGDSFYGARFTAMEALLVLDTPIVTAVVEDSLDSPNPRLQAFACDLLGALGTADAIKILLERSFVSEGALHSHAVVALARADQDDRYGLFYFLHERESDRLTLLKLESLQRDRSHVQ